MDKDKGGAKRKAVPKKSIMKARMLTYENPPKEVQEAQQEAARRVRDRIQEVEVAAQPKYEEMVEAEKYARIISQLKAAEARSRLRIMRLRYDANKDEDIQNLIACQATAMEAVRLEAILAFKDEEKLQKKQHDSLSKLERSRVETVLYDNVY